MKEFISGAIAAFSVVAVYNLAKNIVSKKKPNIMKPKASITLANSLDEPSSGNTIIPDNLFGQGKGHKYTFSAERANEIQNNKREDDIQPKLFSFNKDFIDERKALMCPSGFVVPLSAGTGLNYYFKADILNVLKNTDERIVIIDYDGLYKEFIEQIGGVYSDILPDECNYNNLHNYECSRYSGNEINYVLSPLTERITCFNLDYSKCFDFNMIIKTAFCKADLTNRSDCKYTWFFIPLPYVARFHAITISDIMKCCRPLGIIVTAALDVNDIVKEDIKYCFYNHDYNVLTDNIEKYPENAQKILKGCPDSLYMLKEYSEKNE